MKPPVRTDGDLRSIGDADAVAAAATHNPTLLARLVRSLEAENAIERMRAADALEKASRRAPDLLLSHKQALLAIQQRAVQQEVRWHLFQIVPRMPLDNAERLAVFWLAETALNDTSRIVASEALDAMHRLTKDDPSLELRFRQAMDHALASGVPSLSARARKLLGLWA